MNALTAIDLSQTSWRGAPVRITATSVTLPEDLTYDLWAEWLIEVARRHRRSTWILADSLSFGERKYGEMYADAADRTGFKPDYLAILKYVGTSVHPSCRRESLSFTHHRHVASLAPDEQSRLLLEAEKHGWGAAELRLAVTVFKREIEHQQKKGGREMDTLADAVVEAVAIEEAVTSEIAMDSHGQHSARNCKVMLYQVGGEWEIDIVLPNRACFGFDVPVGSITGKHKDGSDWRF
jgi:hypothetical protein